MRCGFPSGVAVMFVMVMYWGERTNSLFKKSKMHEGHLNTTI